jgi:4-hydroxy-3-polyprenylbenzoate decarboxylase
MKAITLAITGASGAQYGLRLLEVLMAADIEVHLLISDAAREVIALETDLDVLPTDDAELAEYFSARFDVGPNQLHLYGRKQWGASVASGSNAPNAMVICPCSSGTLSAVATGASNNLIERAADVMLKERKQLIILHREMPLSTIHLEHLLKLSQLGAVVMPASPGFYHKPQSVSDMIDFVVARILDHLGVDQTLMARWGANANS